MSVTFIKKVDSAKLPQSLVVYLTASENYGEKDFVCGACALATEGGKCSVLYEEKMGTPISISMEKGSCCLYVGGEPSATNTPASVQCDAAGYVEEGPYSCKRCKSFAGEGECLGVQSKPREIAANGCCDGWEKKEE